MTQRQIDWFISTLEGSQDIDGVVILMHMGFGNSRKGQRDTSNINEFISELSHTYSNSYDYYGPEDPYMIPEILESFITGENINKVYNPKSEIELNVHTHFKGEGKLLGYFGGHLHWDEIEYLREFPSQLQLLIAFCGSGVGSNWNDLDKNCGCNFNVVDVDLFTKQMLIRRVGANTTVSGRERNSISFTIL